MKTVIKFKTEIIEAAILIVLLCSTILSLFQSLLIGIPAVVIVLYCIAILAKKIRDKLKFR